MLDVAIVGAGFAGLGTAIRLRQKGITNFAVLERGSRVGGTWRDNTYPGAACDIPSRLYSYSFAPNANWSHTYSGSAEILRYIDHIVAKYALTDVIRFAHNVIDLTYDDGAWLITVAGQADPLRARTVVVASGPLANPSFPAIRGIDDFAGHRIHSARWDHEYDFGDRSVAVIGTGASAVQIVPELVERAAKVKVFQRTPAWVLPRLNRRTSGLTKSVYRTLPGAESLARQAWYWGHESVALGAVWELSLIPISETTRLSAIS